MSFSHDIFISYARVDNHPRIFGKDSTCWISRFKNELRHRLDSELGGKGLARIWMDLANLDRIGSVTDGIEKAIADTRAFVVMLSKGYLNSEWCRKELNLFIAAAGGIEAARERMVIIHMQRIPYEERPEELRDSIGYDFFYEDTSSHKARLLADPAPHEGQPEYFEKLTDLAHGLSSQIGKAPMPKPSSSAPTIYLAKTTQNLKDSYYDELTSFLDEKGYPYLPKDGDILSDSEAESCKLFVQLLAEPPSSRDNDIPRGRELSCYSQALTLQLPTIRWRPRGLDLEAIKSKDPLHHDLINASDVRESDFSELKNFIAESLHSIDFEGARRPQSGNRQFIVIRHSGKSDQAFAESIASELDSEDFDYDTVAQDHVFEGYVQDEDTNGIIVVFGDSPSDWVADQLRITRRLMLDRKESAPICGVARQPPPNERPLGMRFRGLHLLEEPSQWKTFFGGIRGESA